MDMPFQENTSLPAALSGESTETRELVKKYLRLPPSDRAELLGLLTRPQAEQAQALLPILGQASVNRNKTDVFFGMINMHPEKKAKLSQSLPKPCAWIDSINDGEMFNKIKNVFPNDIAQDTTSFRLVYNPLDLSQLILTQNSVIQLPPLALPMTGDSSSFFSQDNLSCENLAQQIERPSDANACASWDTYPSLKLSDILPSLLQRESLDPHIAGPLVGEFVDQCRQDLHGNYLSIHCSDPEDLDAVKNMLTKVVSQRPIFFKMLSDLSRGAGSYLEDGSLIYARPNEESVHTKISISAETQNHCTEYSSIYDYQRAKVNKNDADSPALQAIFSYLENTPGYEGATSFIVQESLNHAHMITPQHSNGAQYPSFSTEILNCPDLSDALHRVCRRKGLLLFPSAFHINIDTKCNTLIPSSRKEEPFTLQHPGDVLVESLEKAYNALVDENQRTSIAFSEIIPPFIVDRFCNAKNNVIQHILNRNLDKDEKNFLENYAKSGGSMSNSQPQTLLTQPHAPGSDLFSEFKKYLNQISPNLDKNENRKKILDRHIEKEMEHTLEKISIPFVSEPYEYYFSANGYCRRSETSKKGFLRHDGSNPNFVRLSSHPKQNSPADTLYLREDLIKNIPEHKLNAAIADSQKGNTYSLTLQHGIFSLSKAHQFHDNSVNSLGYDVENPTLFFMELNTAYPGTSTSQNLPDQYKLRGKLSLDEHGGDINGAIKNVYLDSKDGPLSLNDADRSLASYNPLANALSEGQLTYNPSNIPKRRQYFGAYGRASSVESTGSFIYNLGQRFFSSRESSVAREQTPTPAVVKIEPESMETDSHTSVSSASNSMPASPSMPYLSLFQTSLRPSREFHQPTRKFQLRPSDLTEAAHVSMDMLRKCDGREVSIINNGGKIIMQLDPSCIEREMHLPVFAKAKRSLGILNNSVSRSASPFSVRYS